MSVGVSVGVSASVRTRLGSRRGGGWGWGLGGAARGRAAAAGAAFSAPGAMEAAIQRELAAADQQGAECEYMNLDSRFVQARVEGLDGLTGLQELSLANCGLQSLEGFPALSQLTKVTLSDNKVRQSRPWAPARGRGRD